VSKPTTTTTAAPWRQPHLLVLAGLVVFLVSLTLICRSALSLGIVLERLLTEGALVAIWIFADYLLGRA